QPRPEPSKDVARAPQSLLGKVAAVDRGGNVVDGNQVVGGEDRTGAAEFEARLSFEIRFDGGIARTSLVGHLDQGRLADLSSPMQGIGCGHSPYNVLEPVTQDAD